MMNIWQIHIECENCTMLGAFRGCLRKILLLVYYFFTTYYFLYSRTTNDGQKCFREQFVMSPLRLEYVTYLMCVMRSL